MTPISTWEPSELDKQTQIAKQALARIAELEAENTELRKQNEILATTRRLAEAERDALRQGCTCANFNSYKQNCNLDLSPCHHHALCHFTPSRWQPREEGEG